MRTQYILMVSIRQKCTMDNVLIKQVKKNLKKNDGKVFEAIVNNEDFTWHSLLITCS